MNEPARHGWILLCASLLAGCGAATVESFTPQKDTAEVALLTALEAWLAGEKESALEDTDIAVTLADPVVEQGAKLASYELIKPLEGDNPRQFLVKVTLEGGAPQEVVYVVVGKDPLYVMPKSEYDRTSEM